MRGRGTGSGFGNVILPTMGWDGRRDLRLRAPRGENAERAAAFHDPHGKVHPPATGFGSDWSRFPFNLRSVDGKTLDLVMDLEMGHPGQR